MSFWNEEMSREVALSQWRTHQVVLAVWLVLTVIMPLLWGWGQSFWVALQTLLVLGLPPALLAEFGRRQMNRAINEDACKWVWQK